MYVNLLRADFSHWSISRRNFIYLYIYYYYLFILIVLIHIQGKQLCNKCFFPDLINVVGSKRKEIASNGENYYNYVVLFQVRGDPVSNRIAVRESRLSGTASRKNLPSALATFELPRSGGPY